MVYQLSVS